MYGSGSDTAMKARARELNETLIQRGKQRALSSVHTSMYQVHCTLAGMYIPVVQALLCYNKNSHAMPDFQRHLYMHIHMYIHKHGICSALSRNPPRL